VTAGAINLSTSSSSEVLRVLVPNVNGDGTVAWQKLYGPDGVGDAGTLVAPTADGGTIVLANRTGVHPGGCFNGNGCTGQWLMKLDPAGNIAWQRPFKTTANGDVSPGDPGSLRQTREGGYAVSYFTLYPRPARHAPYARS
jgi:hypothetical protein